jgi:hypothetical protein
MVCPAATSLTLTADWSNGGANVIDKVVGADVTRLAIFQSSDTNVAQVSGAVVQVGMCVWGCLHDLPL